MALDAPPRIWPALLVVASLGAASARVIHVERPVSDNDRARWATVHALLEDGQFAIGRREPRDARYEDVGLVADARYKSVDVVLDPRSGLFYSSKHPLLPALVALQCKVTGCAFDDDAARASTVRRTLVVWSLLPILIVLLAVARLTRGDPWLMVVAGFGTFVTSFAAGLNNHLPAAAACAVTLVAVAEAIAPRSDGAARRGAPFLVAGLAAGFAATQELPALALVAVVTFVLALFDARRALALTLPAAVVMLAVALGAQAAAYGGQLFITFPREWYRFEGAYWLSPVGIDAPDRSVVRYAFHFLVGHHGIWSLTPPFALALVAGARAAVGGRDARKEGLVVAGVLGVLVLSRALAQGLDLPMPVALAPACLAGAAALVAPWGWWRGASVDTVLGRMALSLTVVMVGFYVAETTNYGGVSMGPRWFIVLTPLWLVAMRPVVEELSASARGRALLAALIGVAVLSATPSEQNPYVHPWLYGG